MNKLMIQAVLAFLSISIAAHAAPINVKSALNDASANGQFLFLTFYQAKDASLTKLSSTIAAFKKSSSEKIAVFDAAISDPANKEIADKYGIQAGQLPLLLVIAPNGVVTGGYPGNVTADQLKKSVGVSDLILKVLKPLQEQKVVLVALQNAATKMNAESWAGVSDFANDANFKQIVSAIKADPAASGSQDFVKQCNLIAPITQATVVLLLPPGRIGKVLTGKTTKDEILKSLKTCTAGSGCCSDRRFKQNVKPIASALEKTAKLQGVTFTWNRKEYPERFFSDGPQIGLIAQDVEVVIPEVVRTDAEGYKSITYDKLTALLIEAVKELKQRIDEQDSLIQEQNARIKALEGK
ncbi:MAG: tail fiber domain-containing protein [Proteobacteria bacterium]|nr:tail fiber domain-containing protein [Pseudomonadota bacterium]